MVYFVYFNRCVFACAYVCIICIYVCMYACVFISASNPIATMFYTVAEKKNHEQHLQGFFPKAWDLFYTFVGSSSKK